MHFIYIRMYNKIMYVAMLTVVEEEGEPLELITNCKKLWCPTFVTFGKLKMHITMATQ